VRCDLCLKITSVRQKYTNSDSSGSVVGVSKYDLELDVAPVIRVWVSGVSPAGGAAPIPLGRSLVRPSSIETANMPPCVNVQVWQKNSSATDGTLTPVYDLYSQWATLGEPES